MLFVLFCFGWLFSPCHSSAASACAVRVCPQQGARVPRCGAGPSRGRSRLPPCPRAAAAAPSALPGAGVVPPPPAGRAAEGAGSGAPCRGTPLFPSALVAPRGQVALAASPGGWVGVGVSSRGTPLRMAVSGGARSRCDPSSRQPGSQSGSAC